MSILPCILFYSSLLAFVLSMLITFMPDEMSAVFYFMLDSVHRIERLLLGQTNWNRRRG